MKEYHYTIQGPSKKVSYEADCQADEDGNISIFAVYLVDGMDNIQEDIEGSGLADYLHTEAQREHTRVMAREAEIEGIEE